MLWLDLVTTQIAANMGIPSMNYSFWMFRRRRIINQLNNQDKDNPHPSVTKPPNIFHINDHQQLPIMSIPPSLIKPPSLNKEETLCKICLSPLMEIEKCN